jgi:molybdate/tungstate transport system permease protein
MSAPRLHILGAIVALGLLHVLTGLLPGQPISLPTNVVLFSANLYVLYCARMIAQSGSPTTVGLFGLGYFLLFFLVLVFLDRQSLFILLIVVYASVFRVTYLLGYFILFVLCFVIFQPYSFETFVPMAFGYAVLYQAKKVGVSAFVLGSLGLGLLCLLFVLFPLLHLSILDSPRTLGYVLERSDVQRALWISISSSSVSTLLTTLWGVPLAYALARTQFRGKAVVESFIDLPILVPQSVVGVALLTLLGPGSPMGQMLAERLDLQIAGRFIGIVIAQVFVCCPFLIKTAMTAFEGVPLHLESAARTLGASPWLAFWRISLPLASRGVLVGMILAWSRAVSEFGSIILFANTPLSAPILVHNEFIKSGITESRPIAVLLLTVCLWIFVLLQFGQTFLPAGMRRPREERL